MIDLNLLHVSVTFFFVIFRKVFFFDEYITKTTKPTYNYEIIFVYVTHSKC